MPKMTRFFSIIVAVMSALMLGACASNQERIGQFADFAEAGTTYTGSVTSLLDASFLITIVSPDFMPNLCSDRYT